MEDQTARAVTCERGSSMVAVGVTIDFLDTPLLIEPPHRASILRKVSTNFLGQRVVSFGWLSHSSCAFIHRQGNVCSVG